MTADPPVTPAAPCATCHGPRPLNRQASQLPNLRAHLEADPFCSSPCCRAWHGCELPVVDKARQENGRRSAMQHRARRGWDEEQAA